jgi:hypothetical protein
MFPRPKIAPKCWTPQGKIERRPEVSLRASSSALYQAASATASELLALVGAASAPVPPETLFKQTATSATTFSYRRLIA